MPDSFRVIMTEAALKDLQEVVAYIRCDSPQNAEEVALALVAAIDSLVTMPNRFRIVGKSRKRGTPIRAALVYPYFIYYRVDERTQAVHVLHIARGTRRPRKGFE